MRGECFGRDNKRTSLPHLTDTLLDPFYLLGERDQIKFIIIDKISLLIHKFPEIIQNKLTDLPHNMIHINNLIILRAAVGLIIIRFGAELLQICG